MPTESKTDHVRKRCDCSKWKECKHPRYIDAQEGRRRYRRNLDTLIRHHAADFAEAKREGNRAIQAWKAGRDAADLQPDDRPTLAVLLASYQARPHASPADKYQAGPICRTVVHGRPFGEWHAAEITRDMLEVFRRQRPLVAGNRNLALLRAVFNWAVLSELVTATPFKVGTVNAVKLRTEAARTRRLHPGEDERLLLAANGLRDLIIAALETGCRQGELLSLQWHQVGADVFLPAGKTKAKKPRRVPISSVLRGVLNARRLDPAGEPLPPSAFVFGDEVGRRRGSIKSAWATIVLKANGISRSEEPELDRGDRGRSRKSICTSTICAERPAHAGWMRASPWRRFSDGSAITTSARRRRIWRRAAAGMPTRCGRLKRRWGV